MKEMDILEMIALNSLKVIFNLNGDLNLTRFLAYTVIMTGGFTIDK